MKFSIHVQGQVCFKELSLHVEQFSISPFHQHQMIQFPLCTSWVYLA